MGYLTYSQEVEPHQTRTVDILRKDMWLLQRDDCDFSLSILNVSFYFSGDRLKRHHFIILQKKEKYNMLVYVLVLVRHNLQCFICVFFFFCMFFCIYIYIAPVPVRWTLDIVLLISASHFVLSILIDVFFSFVCHIMCHVLLFS